ncbi:jacalin-related lectin 19-like isoform X3 [Juglans microcarpa x Juglans regia]|uniref:jacalin-related lectin 19-like isoform X3 n=1 Tax=Juglans microcarpa x Juglans regia TaxID=2249226 RepID=UPI001B7E36F9|nr:jacalin-related lectin 19-like isoform X3 [Juglans microcarpa x Juglans regia]
MFSFPVISTPIMESGKVRGASCDDGIYHGVRAITLESGKERGASWDDEIYHGESDEERESRKKKGILSLGQWRGYGGPSWDDGICHGVREITLESDTERGSGKKKRILSQGPWGGNGGASWDDGIYDGVREITLVYALCINSIRVVYDKNGKPVLAEKHGGRGDYLKAEIKLQYPEEFLVRVSGHYSEFNGSQVIRSLSFESNRRNFGPFGVEEGTPFTSSILGGSIVGFYGRSGRYIDSIGFWVSSWVLEARSLMFKAPERSVKVSPGLFQRLLPLDMKKSKLITTLH